MNKKFISIQSPLIPYQEQTRRILEGFSRLIKLEERKILISAMKSTDKNIYFADVLKWEQKITEINKYINSLNY